MTKVSYLVREFLGIMASTVLILGIVAVGLSTLNSVSAQLRQSDRIIEFQNLHEAQSELEVSISLPAYYPDYLSWPPASVTAQRKPVLAILTSILSREQDREALWISQVMAEDNKEFLTQLPEPARVIRRLRVELEGDEGEMVVGRDAEGEPYNYIRWRHSNLYFAIATIHAPEELIKMARSMTY